MAKSTSKMDFFDKNREMAEGLAIQEFADAKEKAKETQVNWLITGGAQQIISATMISDKWVVYGLVFTSDILMSR